MSRVAFILLCLTAVAAPSFWVPFRWDEAWYLTVGEELARGQVLYRDIWELTNPGIFLFYAAAGVLFGFTEDGVRLLDFLWQAAFALTVARAVMRAYALPRLPVLPAVVVGGLYYLAGYTETGHLSRNEGLVVFPLFVAVWGVTAGGRRWLVAAGAAAAAVALFKLMLGGLVAVGWLAVLAQSAREGSARRAVRSAGWIAVGAAVALAPVLLYFAAHGALGIAGWTLFVAPRLSVAEAEPAGLNRLVIAVRWFASHLAGPAAVAVVGIACRWRAGRDPFLVAWLAVLAASVPVVLAQRLSWWTYHWMLPAGLIGVMIAYTLPAVATTAAALLGTPPTGRHRAVAAVAGIAACLPLLAAGAYQVLQGAKHRFGLTAADRAAARAALGRAYALAQREADWLAQPDRLPGDIFVCGDALIYRFSGRRPGNRVPGGTLEAWPRVIREEMAADLRRRKPVYVFLAKEWDDYERVVSDRYPAVRHTLHCDYRRVRETPYGNWYERK